MILLALMAASVATSPVAAADKADLHCIAIFSMLACEMPEEKAGMTGAIMFYFGRIEGRGSALDLDRALDAATEELVASGDLIKSEAKRCGNEMAAKGDEIQRIGNAVTAASDQRSGKK